MIVSRFSMGRRDHAQLFSPMPGKNLTVQFQRDIKVNNGMESIHFHNVTRSPMSKSNFDFSDDQNSREIYNRTSDQECRSFIYRPSRLDFVEVHFKTCVDEQFCRFTFNYEVTRMMANTNITGNERMRRTLKIKHQFQNAGIVDNNFINILKLKQRMSRKQAKIGSTTRNVVL